MIILVEQVYLDEFRFQVLSTAMAICFYTTSSNEVLMKEIIAKSMTKLMLFYVKKNWLILNIPGSLKYEPQFNFIINTTRHSST